jgi:hypothetical protein
MNSLAYQRCFNHAQREAAARCPECTRFFCRECVTEHEDRVLCAVCLKKLAETSSTKRRALANVWRVIQCVLGILVAWFFFFLIGEGLASLPDSFHENSLWQVPWIGPE